MKKALRISWRILRTLVVGLCILYLALVWLISTDWMQRKLVPYVEGILGDALHTRVEIGSFSIHLPGKAVVREFVMYDQAGQPMISAPDVRLSLLNLDLWAFLLSPGSVHEITVAHGWLAQPDVRFYRSRSTGRPNFQFLAELGDTTRPRREGGGLRLDFADISLEGGHFSWTDSTRSDTVLNNRDKLNFSRLDVQEIGGTLSWGLTEHGIIHSDIRSLHAYEYWSGLRVDALSGFWALGRPPVLARGTALQVRGLDLVTGNTRIAGDAQAIFGRDTAGGQTSFEARADLRPSSLDFTGISCLLDRPLPLEGIAAVRGPLHFIGDTLRSDSLYIAYRTRSEFFVKAELIRFTRPEDLRMSFEFHDSRLDYADLQALLPGTEIPLAGNMGIEGRISGKLYELKSKDLRITYLDGTRVKAKVRIHDFQDPENMVMDVDFENSELTAADLHSLLPKVDFPAWMDYFGTMNVDGNFLGGIRDFVVHADFDTRVGQLSSNLHLVLPPRTASGLIEYNGNLETTALNVDALHIAASPISRYLNFSGNVRGSGTKFKDLTLDLDGTFRESDLMGYHLDLVETDSLHILDQKIGGVVNLKDAQGNASLALDLNMKDSLHSYNFTGDIARVDMDHYLERYGISTDSALLTSVVNVKLSGNSADAVLGRAKFFLLTLERPRKQTRIDIHDLIVRARENTVRSKWIEMRSSVLDMDLKGDFSWERGLNLATRLEKESRLYLGSQDSVTQAYYATKQHDSLPLRLDVSFYTGPEFNALTSFLNLPFQCADSSSLRLGLDAGEMDLASLNWKSDSFRIASVNFVQNMIEFNAYKDAAQNSLIASGTFRSDTVCPARGIAFQNLIFEPNVLDSAIEYWISFRQDDLQNRYRFNGLTTLSGGAIQTRIKPGVSGIETTEGLWQVMRPNLIYYRDGRVFIEDLALGHGAQSIRIEGVLSPEDQDKARVRMDHVRLEELISIAGARIGMEGEIDSLDAHIGGVLEHPRMNVTGHMKDFSYKTLDSLEIDLLGYWQYVPGAHVSALRTVWSYRETPALIVKGLYDIGRDKLDLRSDSSRIPLVWLEPFAEGFASNMGGYARVNALNIKGSRLAPSIYGNVLLENATARLDYLGTQYRMANLSRLEFDNEKITIPDMVLYDSTSHTAHLKGTIIHNGTADVRLNLKVDQLRDFMAMNTRARDNELFYGRIIVSGDSCLIQGSLDQIVINAWASTAKGTWLDIPLSDYTSASRLDFVTFSGGADTARVKKKTDLSGFRMRLLVHATPDARVRMIFDEQVGDIMEAYGEGDITLEITDKGEFTMYGSYEIDKGDYLFTAQNVVNKKFVVDRGGTITWEGNPYAAKLRLDAVYKVTTDLSTLLGDAAASTRVPVDIVMHMTGSLTQPLISLNLRLSGMDESDVLGLSSYLRNIQYDEQELNRQVVTLLMFRRFAPKADGASGPAGGVTSSISELISNQVNYWLSQAFNQDLSLNVNTNQFQNVEVAIRYSLFGDRVTIERNGTLIGNRSNTASIGDLSVLIKLLPAPVNLSDTAGADSNGTQPQSAPDNPGQFVMEIFNRENLTFNNTSTNTTGAGLFYKKDFDHIGDLFRRRNKDRKGTTPEKVILEP